MKLLLLSLTLIAFVGCVTDPNTGHKVYTGPTLSVGFGYNGATVQIGIVGQPNPTPTPAPLSPK